MNLEIIKSINKQKAINAIEVILENISILQNQTQQNISLDLEEIKAQTNNFKEELNKEDLSLGKIDDILSFIERTHHKLISF